ncbi:6-bladed beta-propeller [candidate division KSB1 bacterium]
MEEVGGIRVVHNHQPQWGGQPEVALEFVQKIGDIDTADEPYIMYNIRDVCRDDEGNIYILDSGNTRIQVFDPAGRYIRTIGRKGEGPGEFSRPTNLNIDSENLLYIGDDYYFFVLDKYGREIRKLAPYNNDARSRCRVLPDGKIVLGAYGMSNAGKERYDEILFCLFNICDSEGKNLVNFGKPEVFEVENNIYIYHDAPYETDKDGNLLIAYRYRNKIEKCDSAGDVIFSFDRPLNFEETQFTGFSRYPNSISMGIGIDHRDRIWVVTIIEQPPLWREEYFGPLRFRTEKKYTVFEIFSDDGILLGTVPFPDDMYMMRMCGDRLFLVDPDRISVSEYRIVDK